MLIGVPQYIDVEDKIVGPLTAKQLGWCALAGIIDLGLWKFTNLVILIMAGLPLTGFFLALAFFKPYGVPLGNFLMFGVMYLFKPKIYFWQRTPRAHVVAEKKPVEEESVLLKKQMTSESIRNLAELIDSGGSQHSEMIEEILKKSSK